MAKPDPLARSLIRACQELTRRRTWERTRDDAPFLLRVPTEEEPLAGVFVPPEAGSNHGLFLSCGPSALDRLYQALLRPDLEEPGMDEVDMLCISYERWGELLDEFRKPLLLGGLQARRESVVPYLFSRPKEQDSRPPNRREMKTMVWCLQAIFAAEDRDELAPRALYPEFPVLQLEASGKMRAPEVEVSLVSWEASEVADVEPPLQLPADLGELPRTEERWLAAAPLLPGRPEGEEGAWCSFVVSVDGTGEVPLTRIMAVGDDEALVEALAEALRSRGRPGEILFADGRLREQLEPGLAALSVKTELASFDPRFLLLRTAVLSGLEAATGSMVPWTAPATREEWEELDRDFTHRQFIQITTEEVGGPHAIERYFGDEGDAKEVLQELSEMFPFSAYVEWLVADFRESPDSPTFLERQLEEPKLHPADRTLIEARIEALHSIFLVLPPEDDDALALEVEDLVTGERYLVQDEDLLLSDADGAYWPMRLLQVQEWFLPVPVGPPLEAEEVEAAVEWLKSLGLTLDREGMRRDAHLLGRLWFRHLLEDPDEEEPLLPSLNASDREELLEFMTERNRRWLDERTPALGGLTPRQACRSEEGKRKVARMLQNMPAMELPGGGELKPPLGELMRELGIEGE